MAYGDQTDFPSEGYSPARPPADDLPDSGYYPSTNREAQAPLSPPESDLWHDIPKGLEAGYRLGVAAPIYTGRSYVAEDPEQARYFASAAREQREIAEAKESGMTPGFKESWPGILSEAAAPMGAMALPGMAAGFAGAPAAAVMGAYGLAGGLFGGLQTGSDISGVIDKTPTETLSAHRPDFKAEIDSGVPEETARFNLTNRVLTENHAVAKGAALGAAASIAGPEASLMGADPLRALKVLGGTDRRLVALALSSGIGAGEATAVVAPQMIGQNYVEQKAAYDVGAGEEPTLGSATKGIGPGLLLASGLGGLGGALHSGEYYHPGIDKEPRAGSKTTPARAAEPGKATSVGSPTDYAKPKAGVPGRSREGGIITEPATSTVDALSNQPAAPPPPGQEGSEPVSPLADVDIAAAAAAREAPRPTPESEQPQARPVDTTQVAENVQPKVEPAQAAPGGPLAAETSPPVPPPQSAREVPPAPSPAPAARAPEVVMREPDSTRREQFAALVDRNNPREALVYDPGEQPIEIVGRDKSRYGQLDLKDGRVIQYDRSGPSKLTKEKVSFADKNDRLNELLQMGPVNKQEVDARVAAGETPIATVERTPDGTEVKAAHGTDQTADVQRAAFEETKSAPENTVQHEQVKDTIADRFNKVRQENIEKAQAREPVVPTGRVVRDVSEEGQAAAAHTIAVEAEQARTVEEQLKAQQAEKEKGGKNRQLKEKAEIKRTNDLADNISAGNPAQGKYEPNDVYNRAKHMVDQANLAKIDLPEDFREGHSWNPSVLKLREAKDLVGEEGSIPKKDAYSRYIVMEHLIDNGQHEDAYAVRRAEGARGLGSPEGAESGMRVRPKGGAVDEEGHALEEREGGVEQEAPPDTLASVKPEETEYEGEREKAEREAKEAAAKAAEEEAQRWEARLAEREAKAREPAPAGFQVQKVVAGRRKLEGVERPKINVGEALKAKREKPPEGEIPARSTRQEAPEDLNDKFARIRAAMASRMAEIEQAEGGVRKGPKTIVSSHDNGTVIDDLHTQGEENVRHLLKNVDYSVFDKDLRHMMKIMVDRMLKVVGDMPVYWVNKDEMRRTGTQSYGVFVHQNDHILMNSDYVHPEGRQVTALHEVLHATVEAMYRHDPEFRKLLEQLRAEAVGQWAEKIDPAYGFSEAEKNAVKNGSEFLAEIMSNPKVQETFKSFRISSDLAKKLDIPRWRIATMWHGLLSAIQQSLGLPTRAVSVIEAAMRMTEIGSHARPGASDALIEYQGKFMNAAKGPLDKIEPFKAKKDTFFGEDTFKPPATYRQVIDNPDEAGKDDTRTLKSVGSKVGEYFQSASEHMSASMLDTLASKILPLMPSDAMRIRWEHLFGAKDEHNPFLRAQERHEKMSARMRTLMAPSDPMLKEIQMMEYQTPEVAEAFDSLIHDSSEASFHPGQKIGEGLNKHLSGRPEPSNTNLNDWMAHANREYLLERYNALGDKRELFDRTIDFMHKLGLKEIAATRVNMANLIADNYRKNADFQDILSRARSKSTLSESDREQLGRYTALDKVIRKAALDDKDKVWDNNTATEKEKFATGKSADPNIKALLEYDAMERKNGPYIPSSRFGEHTVRATHTFDTPEGGERDPAHPDTDVVFEDRKKAFQFMGDLKRDTGLSSKASIAYYFDGPNGREYVPDKSPVQSGNTNITPKSGIRIRVQTKHFEMAESLAEANKKRAALLQDPTVDPNSVSQVELTRNNRRIDYGLNQPAVRAMTDAIDGLTHLDPEARQQMKNNLQHVAVAQMQGARLSKNLLRRNNVRGVSNDLLRTLDQRRIAASAFIAKSEIMPEVNRAMDDMRDALDANDTPDSFKMSAIIKEMQQRIYGLGQDGYTGKQISPTLARINNIAFMQYLISPAHVMLHLSHPFLVSIPTMASKPGRGMYEAYRRTLATYRDMGGLSEIGTGTKKAFKVGAADYVPTDFVADIKNTLRKHGATEDELNAIDRGLETNHLHNTGYDFTEAYRGLNKADRGLAMARDFSSEITSSADAINRIGTYLTEYRWSRDQGLTHEQAIRSAKDTLSETQGLFSATNRARWLQDPRIRAFMQFRQFPMLIYNMLAKHAYNTFFGATKEAKWQAAKALTGMIGTGMALTGLAGGIPEPIRLGVTLLNALGLTDSWQEEEDKVRRWVANHWGPQVAGFLMDGLAGMGGIDIHHRGGFNSLLFQFDPKSTSPADMQNWVYNWMGGTPAGVAMDAYTGVHDLLTGDNEAAFEHLMPSKAIVDLARAYRMGIEGKRTPSGKQVIPPLGWGGMAAYGIGFTPESVARANTAQAVLNARQREAQTAHQKIQEEYRDGNKSKAIQQMRQWNVTHPERPMKMTDLTSGNKQTIFGQNVTPASQQYLKEYQRAYLQ